MRVNSQNPRNQRRETGEGGTVKELSHVIAAKAIHRDSNGDHFSVCSDGKLWRYDVTITDRNVVGMGEVPWQVKVIRVSAGERVQAVTTDGWTVTPGRNTRLFN